MVMLTRNPKGPQDLGKTWLDCFLSTSYSFFFFFHFLVCIPLFLCINMQLSMCYCSINNPTTHPRFLTSVSPHYMASVFCGPLQTHFTLSPLNISGAIHAAVSFSDVTGCYSATGPVWHQSCPDSLSLSHCLAQGIDCLLQHTLLVFYISLMHIHIQTIRLHCKEIWV